MSLMIPRVPLGLIFYGWSAEIKPIRVGMDIGIEAFTCGIELGVQAMRAFIMGAYSEFTASAVVGSQPLRGLIRFRFPDLPLPCMCD